MKPQKTLYFLIAILQASGCSDQCPSKQGRVYLENGTSKIMLACSSEADGKTIPIYLALPVSQPSPLKAVVVLHGSGGAWDDHDTNGDGIGDVCNVGTLSKQNREWEALLTANGYAVAFPDSYTPRNTCENEGDYKNPPLKFKISATFVRNRDAESVLELLSQLTWKDSNAPVVDVSNVAVMGFSDGGTAVLSTVYDESSTPPGWVWQQSFDGINYTKEVRPPSKKGKLSFKTAVAYYPGAYHNGYYGNPCNSSGIYTPYCDIQFHLPSDDPLTKNSECLIANMAKIGSGENTVYRYENADHGFDSNDEPESGTARMRTILYLNQQLSQ